MKDSESTTAADSLSDLPDLPLVSVVITTYDEAIYDDFTECVRSVLDQTYDHVEVVIVTETDYANERVSDEFADLSAVNHVHSAHSLNLASARNLGAERATGDVYAFIDDDAVADPEWLARIVDAYEREDALAVGGKLTARWPDSEPKYLPPEFYWLVGVTHRGFREDEGPVRNTFGANITFRADVFDKLGGYNTDFGKDHGHNLQGEETELCARVDQRYERRLYYVPEAEVTHRVYQWQMRYRWLFDRACWQGYSKRLLQTTVAGSTTTEVGFLQRVILRSIPGYIANAIQMSSLVPLFRMGFLLMLTTLVGLGYLYGLFKIRG